MVRIEDIKRRDNAVKSSFSKVRTDINNIKRRLNKQFFEIEDLSKRLDALTTKEEFYSFVKDLTSKLDQMEQVFIDRKLLNMHKEEFLARLEALRNELRRREDFGRDIKTVRAVRKDLDDLGDRILDKEEFKRETKEIDNQVLGLRQQIKNLEEATKDIKELTKLRVSIERVEKDFVSWKEFFKKTKDIKDVLAINQESFEELREEIQKVKKARIPMKDFEKGLKSAEELLKKLSNQVGALEEKLVTKEKMKEIEASLKEIKKLRERPLAEKELKSVREDINYLTQNIVTQADLSARLSSFEEEIEELKGDVKRLKSKKVPEFGDFAIKLEKPLEEEVEGRPSLVKRLISKISDFFKEEEEPAEKVEELIKEEEEKEEKKEVKERPTFVKYIFIALILTVLAGGGYIIFSKLKTPTPTPAITTNITNITLYEEKQKECILAYECQPNQNQTWYDCYYDEKDQKCHCYLGEESKCHPERVAAYTKKQGILLKISDFVFRHKILTGAIIVIIVAFLLVIFWRGKEEEPEEETIDLEEFFKEKKEEKEEPKKK